MLRCRSLCIRDLLSSRRCLSNRLLGLLGCFGILSLNNLRLGGNLIEERLMMRHLMMRHLMRMMTEEDMMGLSTLLLCCIRYKLEKVGDNRGGGRGGEGEG